MLFKLIMLNPFLFKLIMLNSYQQIEKIYGYFLGENRQLFFGSFQGVDLHHYEGQREGGAILTLIKSPKS